MIQNNFENEVEKRVDARLFSPEWRYKWELPDVILPPLSPSRQSYTNRDSQQNKYKIVFGRRKNYYKSKIQVLTEKLRPKPNSKLSKLAKAITASSGNLMSPKV